MGRHKKALQPPEVAEEEQHPEPAPDKQPTSEKQLAVKKKSAGWASAASGAMSGMLVGLILQPLDVIGTRMKGDSAVGKARNTLATARGIIKSHGVGGLWQGSGPSVIRMGLGVGLHMVLVDYAATALTKKLEDGGTHLSAFNAALAGGVPRALATVLLNPVTIIKTRMEYSGADAVRYRDTFDALVTITKAEGVRGLFRGLVPTILTNAPASGLYYMFYTRLRQHLAAPDRPQILVNFASGLVAAISATVATQPFDVIRTRVQLSRQSAAAGTAAGWQAGSLGALRTALSQHGPASLLIGTVPRVLKRTAQTALVWTLYEELLPKVVGAVAVVVSQAQKQQAQAVKA